MEGGCCRNDDPDVRCLHMIYMNTVVLYMAVSLRPKGLKALGVWLPPIDAIVTLEQWYDDDAVA